MITHVVLRTHIAVQHPEASEKSGNILKPNPRVELVSTEESSLLLDFYCKSLRVGFGYRVERVFRAEGGSGVPLLYLLSSTSTTRPVPAADAHPGSRQFLLRHGCVSERF
jgi:hypothetical protein